VQEVEASKEAPLKEEDVVKIANDLLDKVFQDAIAAAKQKLQQEGEDVVDIADINISIDSSYVNEAFVSDEPKGKTEIGIKEDSAKNKIASVTEKIQMPIKRPNEGDKNKVIIFAKKSILIFMCIIFFRSQ